MASKRDLKTIRMHTFVVHYGRRGVSRYLDHRGPKRERKKGEPIMSIREFLFWL